MVLATLARFQPKPKHWHGPKLMIQKIDRGAALILNPPHAMPRVFHVVTTAGTFEPLAVSAAQACSTALELAGPGSRMLRISREGDW